MVQARGYRATEVLRNGCMDEIRALKPEDRPGLLAAVDRTSDQSLYRRFFAFKRGFTDQEVDFYVNVDFVSHVPLIAVPEDGRPVIVGGARYVAVQPGRAEIAFAVDDAHRGKGIGAALLRHLVTLARNASLSELMADVLPENTAMLKVFETSGHRITTRREPDATHSFFSSHKPCRVKLELWERLLDTSRHWKGTIAGHPRQRRPRRNGDAWGTRVH